MKKCNVFIMGLIEQDDHRQIAASLRTMLNKIKTPTEEYKPYILLCGDTLEDTQKALYENASNGCDVIISIGCHMTTTIVRIHTDEGPIPTIFVGVPNPINLGLMKSLQKPGGTLSGVFMEEPSAEHHAQQLFVLYPYVTKICMPYNPKSIGSLIQERATLLIKALTALGFEITPQLVSTAQDAIDFVTNNIDSFDAVLLLEGCSAAAFAEKPIAYICAQADRFLLSSNGMAGINHGASFSYGCPNNILLPEVVNMIRQFWNGRKPLGNLPATVLPSNRNLFVNRFRMPWLPHYIKQNIRNKPDITVLCHWTRNPIDNSSIQTSELL